jgi:hypothetical protein
MPDNIRASHGGTVTFADGSSRELGDNPHDQALREAIAARTETDLNRDFPTPTPSHAPQPGEPMLDPTPSR